MKEVATTILINALSQRCVYSLLEQRKALWKNNAIAADLFPADRCCAFNRAISCSRIVSFLSLLHSCPGSLSPPRYRLELRHPGDDAARARGNFL